MILIKQPKMQPCRKILETYFIFNYANYVYICMCLNAGSL